MRFYHSKYKDRDGRTREAERISIQFADHNRHVRRLTLFKDQRSSEQAARRIEELVSLRAARTEVTPELMAWLGKVDARIREALLSFGLVEADRIAGTRALALHLEAWKTALGAKGDTASHCDVEGNRARRLLVDLCDFKVYQDISPEKVREALALLRDRPVRPGKEDKSQAAGARTRNKYLRAVKGFCRWMVREGRALQNPLACLDAANRKTVDGDARHARRALTDDELRRLLAAALCGPEILGIPGAERALAYRLTAEAGLRTCELRALTRGCFRLDAPAPVLVLVPQDTKAGKGATLPLRPETAALLQEHLAAKLPGALVFRLPRPDGMIDVLRADLEAAGIDYVDAARRFADWHALRHTFISNLAQAGVHPRVAQELARHSDINLTMRVYTHVPMERSAEAVAKLPDLDAPAAAEAVREGTNDAPIASLNAAREGQAKGQAKRNSLPCKDRARTHNPLVAGSNPAGPTSSSTGALHQATT